MLPSNLKILGICYFINNIELEEINISKSLEKIKSRAFENCPKLNKIYYEGTFEDFLKIKNNTLFAANYREIHCTDTRITFNYTKGKWIGLDNNIYTP